MVKLIHMKFVKVLKKHPHIALNYLLSAPFIFGLIVPMVILDICGEVYHRICFPLYGIPYLKRTQYIKIDRQRLAYLNWIEKIFCAYCGYANGLMQYGSALAAETERYFCSIKHKKAKGFKEPAHHQDFLPYNNKKAFKEFLDK